MEAQVFEEAPLPYVLVVPQGAQLDGSLPLVVMLHGFGASMYDLAGLVGAIDTTGYAYAFPNGHLRVDLGYGQSGFSWYERDGVESAPPGSPSLQTRLDGFMADVLQQTNTQPGNIVLSGFSQGGGLALSYGLPRPNTFKALAVLSGFFRGAESVLGVLPPAPSQPIFVTHGTRDSMISLDRAYATLDFLRENGYDPDYHEYPMGHEIPQPVINDLVPWLHKVLPPKVAITL